MKVSIHMNKTLSGRLRKLKNKVWPINWKILRCTFLCYCLFRCTRWFQLSSLRTKSFSMAIQTKANEQHYPVTLTLPLITTRDIKPWLSRLPFTTQFFCAMWQMALRTRRFWHLIMVCNCPSNVNLIDICNGWIRWAPCMTWLWHCGLI